MSGLLPAAELDASRLQFNIVYTPGSIRYLPFFVSSLLATSDASFRLVSNGCSPAERKELRRRCAGHPRLEYWELPSPEVQRHGSVLNYLQSMTKTSHFCVMDSDIFATAAWLHRSSERLRQAAAVFSGMPLWVAPGHDRFPNWFRGLSGEYSHDARGDCLGVTYVALYDNEVLHSVLAREQVGFEAREWGEVPIRLHSSLARQGLLGRHFDTGKLLNVLMRASHRLEFVDEPGLCHIGGASFEVLYRHSRPRRPHSILARLGESRCRPLVTAWRLLQSVRAHRRRLSFGEAFIVMRRRLRQRNPVRSHMLDVLHALFEGGALPRSPDLGSPEMNARLESAVHATMALLRTTLRVESSMQANSTYFYEAFGLAIHANVPLPDFLEVQPRDVDLEIEWSDRYVEEADRPSDRPANQPKDEILYASAGRTGDGAPFFTVVRPHAASPAYLRCRHSSDTGRGCFDIEPSGRRILISASPGLPKSDLMAYLAGPVMGCVLRLQGFTCLHAAVVNVKGRAIALMGPKGSGKSTLAAALAERGYPVLTDDIAAIFEDDGCMKVRPSYPKLRLWPESQKYVPGLSMETLPRVLSTMEKRYQLLTPDSSACQWRFSTRSSPLAALYSLGVSLDNIARITATSLTKGIMVLTANVYAGYLADKSICRRDFHVLGTVASRAAVCNAKAPSGPEGFGQRCAGIIDHIESLP